MGYLEIVSVQCEVSSATHSILEKGLLKSKKVWLSFLNTNGIWLGREKHTDLKNNLRMNKQTNKQM